MGGGDNWLECGGDDGSVCGGDDWPVGGGDDRFRRLEDDGRGKLGRGEGWGSIGRSWGRRHVVEGRRRLGRGHVLGRYARRRVDGRCRWHSVGRFGCFGGLIHGRDTVRRSGRLAGDVHGRRVLNRIQITNRIPVESREQSHQELSL